MSKLNAQKKTIHVLPHETDDQYPNDEYRHSSDEDKNEQAIKGDFGTKAQLHSKLSDVKAKFPGIHITHKHNSTVR